MNHRGTPPSPPSSTPTDGTRQMVAVESLDVLDLEGVDVQVVETEKSECVLSVSLCRTNQLILTLTSNPNANALTKSAPF